MNPSVAAIDSVASFPFLSSAISGLKAEFSLYAAAPEDIDPSHDPGTKVTFLLESGC